MPSPVAPGYPLPPEGPGAPYTPSSGTSPGGPARPSEPGYPSRPRSPFGPGIPGTPSPPVAETLVLQQHYREPMLEGHTVSLHLNYGQTLKVNSAAYDKWLVTFWNRRFVILPLI